MWTAVMPAYDPVRGTKFKIHVTSHQLSSISESTLA
jgi:hypothetical protein